MFSFLRAPEDVLHSSGTDYDLLNGRAGAISSLWYEKAFLTYLWKTIFSLASLQSIFHLIWQIFPSWTNLLGLRAVKGALKWSYMQWQRHDPNPPCFQNTWMLTLFSFCWMLWRTGFPLIPQSSCPTPSWTSCWPSTCTTQVSTSPVDLSDRRHFEHTWKRSSTAKEVINCCIPLLLTSPWSWYCSCRMSLKWVLKRFYVCVSSVSSSTQQQCDHAGGEEEKSQDPVRESAAASEQRR